MWNFVGKCSAILTRHLPKECLSNFRIEGISESYLDGKYSSHSGYEKRRIDLRF